MRIVMLKNVSQGDMRLKVGGYYALPESLAQDLVDARVAYWECDDPPFDPETREEIARESERANQQAASHAADIRTRDAREQARAARQAADEAANAADVQRILAHRAAAETARRIAEEQANAARLAAEQDKE